MSPHQSASTRRCTWPSHSWSSTRPPSCQSSSGRRSRASLCSCHLRHAAAPAERIDLTRGAGSSLISAALASNRLGICASKGAETSSCCCNTAAFAAGVCSFGGVLGWVSRTESAAQAAVQAVPGLRAAGHQSGRRAAQHARHAHAGALLGRGRQHGCACNLLLESTLPAGTVQESIGRPWFELSCQL